MDEGEAHPVNSTNSKIKVKKGQRDIGHHSIVQSTRWISQMGVVIISKGNVMPSKPFRTLLYVYRVISSDDMGDGKMPRIRGGLHLYGHYS